MALTPEQLREVLSAKKKILGSGDGTPMTPAEMPLNTVAKSPRVSMAGSGGSAPPSQKPPQNKVKHGRNGDQPPFSAEAEEAVLGSMMVSPDFAIPLARQSINANFFYVPAHQTIFNALITLWSENSVADFISLGDFLSSNGRLETVGGRAFLVHISSIMPTGAAIAHFLDIVKAKFALRQIIRAGTEAVRLAYDVSKDLSATPETIFAQLENDLAVAKSSCRGYGRLPQLVDLSTLLGENRPIGPPELIKGVLHQGSKIIVGGTSKGRKTFSLIDLAVSVATGSQWWGFDCAQGPVCYLNFEIQESFFCSRVEVIAKEKSLDVPHGTLFGWNLRGHGEGIENLMGEILNALSMQKFALVVFDPIYKALGDRDENKAGDVASLCNQLERVAVKTGAAVAFGAHYSKGNQALKESIDRIGGSGVFARDPDSILTMTAHEEADAFTVESTLRNFPPVEPFVVRWNYPLFIRTNLDPEDLKQARSRANTGQFTTRYSKASLLDELSIIDGVRPATLLKRLSEMEGISRAQFYRLASSLKNDQTLVEKDGLWFKQSQVGNS